MGKILYHFLIYCYYMVYVFQLSYLVYVVIIDFLFINKLFSSFFSLLIKVEKKYIDIIGPKDRRTNRIFSKIKQILRIKPRLF